MNAELVQAKQQVERPSLAAFFSPQTVALIGATDREGSVGRTVLANLNRGYRGRLFPVNPKHSKLLGVSCYRELGEIPETIDLAVIVTPAKTVPGVVRECVDAGVRSAVILSAGFKELGVAGALLETRIQEELQRGSMRVVGPNCLGMMNPRIGLNATFSQDIALPGNVAFLSQSGALLTAILDWSLKEQVGFSAIVSTGSMVDVGWGDLISFYGDDPETQSILIYMESVGDAGPFIAAAQRVARKKPIIVIKAGRSEAAAKAASSHTGALTGSDEVYDAAFRRAGVLRVQNISDVFYMAEVFGKQPRPQGPRLTIVTNAGGPGVLATDALIANGGELAPLSEETIRELNAILPGHWSHGNPIDILGDASPERYAQALNIAIQDPASDGLLVVLAPQGMTNPAEVAQGLKQYAKGTGKPILASWMGGREIAAGESFLNAAGIPTFAYPDTAARAFCYMWHYGSQLRLLPDSPGRFARDLSETSRRERACRFLASVLDSGRSLLTETESKELLSIYEIPTVPTSIARSPEEAAALAERFGYPVVLKLHSFTVTHKTDVGGVRLNLGDAQALREAFSEIQQSVFSKAGASAFQGVTVQPMIKLKGYELILGSSVDPTFGPVLLFGSGGELVEVYRDRALALPPLDADLATQWMEQTLIYKALKGVRGHKPVDLTKLISILVRFSQMVADLPRISELDINPLIASPDGILALDARVVLHPAQIPDHALPLPSIQTK
jgi:acetyltransferase